MIDALRRIMVCWALSVQHVGLAVDPQGSADTRMTASSCQGQLLHPQLRETKYGIK